MGYSDDKRQKWCIKVLRYQPNLNKWTEVYYEVLNRDETDLSVIQLPAEDEKKDSEIGSSELSVKLSTLNLENGSNSILTLSVISSLGSKILYSVDGENYQLLTNNNDLTSKAIDVHHFLTTSQKLYALAFKGLTNKNCQSCILTRESLISGTWQEIDLQRIFEDKNNLDLYGFIDFNNSLVIATLNKKMGFQIWKYRDNDEKTNTWELAITNGAYRFAHNQKIYAMTVFNSDLYFVSGIVPGVASITQDWYLNSFELTRLYSNNDWDVIAGIPRCTPDGLRVPLSGTGPSFDMGSGAIFQCLVAHSQHLYLGANNEDGFQLWSSQDGENWLLFPPNELTSYYQVKIQEAMSTAFGLLFVLEVMELSGEKHLQIWLAQ
ncbi:hypothetical protein [Anabaena sp. PCC 7108]|uniref:hypothetical protein n=1 Tax=Anabaena sp. PCC 7108 TaxID=163908 RepID=UPI0003816C20|nr:hypothetical protein [Anabaena sp. PCC 7108]